jgi:hypothetical protein
VGHDEVDAFVRDGYTVVRDVIDAATVAGCRAHIRAELARRGVAGDDPATWTRPVIRVPCPAGPPFEAIAESPALIDAFVWGATSVTVRQRAVPEALQGRVASVNSLWCLRRP